MRKIIGFAFAQQSGKTTAAKYLASHYPLCKVDNFAKSLKDGIGKTVFGLTDDQLNDPVLKETIDPFWDMTPRKIMQLAGTECMRNTFSNDIWVRTLEKRITKAAEHFMFAVDDVRYPNEARAIKDWGGIVVRINRDTGIKSSHVSETSLLDYKDFDYTIDNNGSFEDLYIQLDKIAKEYLGK